MRIKQGLDNSFKALSITYRTRPPQVIALLIIMMTTIAWFLGENISSFILRGFKAQGEGW